MAAQQQGQLPQRTSAEMFEPINVFRRLTLCAPFQRHLIMRVLLIQDRQIRLLFLQRPVSWEKRLNILLGKKAILRWLVRRLWSRSRAARGGSPVAASVCRCHALCPFLILPNAVQRDVFIQPTIKTRIRPKAGPAEK